jgi:hypothetical protein
MPSHAVVAVPLLFFSAASPPPKAPRIAGRRNACPFHCSWVIRHSPGDYKTGKLYGQRPPMVIAPFVYPELEAFIQLR